MSSNTGNIWRRLGYVSGFLVVAGPAAIVSYSHIRDVAIAGHQDQLIAHLLPLSVDGLMLIATVAMAEDKAANRFPRGWARFAFWFGAVVSTAANVAATVVAHGVDPLSIAVAAFAPLALLVAIEIVARPGRTRPVVPVEVTPVAEIESLPSNAPVSPAPAGPGRPKIPTVILPEGKVIHSETGEPVSRQTAKRRLNGSR